MFDHISFGVTNLEKSIAFYDAALKSLGVNRMFAMPDAGIAGYSGSGGATFWLYSKSSKRQPLVEIPKVPRFHLAFTANTRADVDAFYFEAINSGGSDEGKPGLRIQYHPNYYAAYIFDLDGYKLEAVCHKP